MGTSYFDIQEMIFRQAWQIAGSQLQAAVALGITPETISRFLRRCDRTKVASPKVPEAWPVVRPPEPPPAARREIGRSNDPATGQSGDRQIASNYPSPQQAMSRDRMNRAIGPSGQRAIDSEDLSPEPATSRYRINRNLGPSDHQSISPQSADEVMNRPPHEPARVRKHWELDTDD
jgi:hypothetical protein